MPSPEHDQMVELLVAMRAAEGADGAEPTLDERRQAYEQAMCLFPVPDDVAVERVDAAGVGADWLTPARCERDRVVLYLHGGGFAIGSARTHRDMAARIGRAAGARVLVIDYRLAPEHRFPAPVEDAVAAYEWLLASGVAADRVVVAGDSAGGGLAIALLIALRERGTPLPAGAVGFSPWTDLTLSGPSLRSKVDDDPVLTPADIEALRDGYLAGADPTHPLASPLFGDLGGLPPLLVHVGTAELILDDSRRLVERVRAAGGEAELVEWDGLVHVFAHVAPHCPEAVEALGQIGDFVHRVTSPTPTHP